MADEDDPKGLKPPRKPRKSPAKKVAAKKTARKAAAKKTVKKPAKVTYLRAVPPAEQDEKNESGEQSYTDDELAELAEWMAQLNDPVVPVEVLDPDDDSEDRAYKAHRLKLRGMAWREIAQRLEYPSEQSARMAHDKYMTAASLQASAATKAHALAMQIDRYEDVLNSVAHAAFEGTIVLDTNKKVVTDKAGNVVREFSASAMGIYVRVLERIDKLMKLEGTEINVQQDIIVIAGSREEYLSGLQGAVRARAVGGAPALPPGESEGKS